MPGDKGKGWLSANPWGSGGTLQAHAVRQGFKVGLSEGKAKAHGHSEHLCLGDGVGCILDASSLTLKPEHNRASEPFHASEEALEISLLDREAD